MTQMDDDDLDRDLSALLAEEPADAAALSRRVLTRLATPAPAGAAGLAEVLALPGPALGLFGGMMAAAMALGYLLLPVMGGEGWVTLGLFGDVLGVTGGF
ncbi:hypothetical protein EOW65_15540 [Sinirhodobacter ferrireducens]|uniref:Uncharacterized protein n=1 Tax=Paenirhodobacter ferrireducens TaxID=1215032 RepID=A0A443L9W8_9RHOB|nr:hypothetical protein [Sinirhodobacter ferrireducens]RWR45948.1 hypothetical protein EOW65_15540 [Sinirhodobacter ferrireducens]